MSKGSGERTSKVAKAGKRHGAVVYPPAPNPENQRRREAGEQQFIAKKQQYMTKEVDVFDKNWKRGVKTITVPIDFTYDVTRKRPVMSPKFSEKKD